VRDLALHCQLPDFETFAAVSSQTIADGNSLI